MVHPDVVLVLGVLGGLGLKCSPAIAETDNARYGAALSQIGGSWIRFRVGRVTPTKVGLFVAVWQRASDGSPEPFPTEGSADTLIVSAREGSRFGAFAFPKTVLGEQGISSLNGVGGKRGFRVYPPWSVAANPQARRSQEWQCAHFVELGDGSALGVPQAKRLFAANLAARDSLEQRQSETTQSGHA